MKTLLVAVAIFLCVSTTAQAELTRLSVESRVPYPANPRFEVLRGHFSGTIDPSNIHDKIINDLPLAVRDAQGRIGYTATFALLKPIDLKQASGVLLYDVSNRGHGDVTAFAENHISVVSGWQGDLAAAPSLQTIEVPVARATDGSPIRGPVLARFMDMPPGQTTLSIKGGPVGGIGGRSFTPATAEGARLLRTTSDEVRPEEVPSADWRFADCTATPFPGTPDLTKLCLRDGFDPKFAYTLSFRAQDPKILAVGFAAMRDLIAFLRNTKTDAAGGPNPVYGHVRYTIGRGVSQSGNVLRTFVHLGFNADEQGHRVFDGLDVLIAARQNPINFRFANPGGGASLYEPGSDGAVWWTRYIDHARGLPVSSLLDRCHVDDTCPKIVEELGSSEFWGLRASPDFVGTDARADLPLPDNVRRYYIPSVTHGGGRGGFSLETEIAPGCLLPANPNPASDTYNAVLEDLITWVTLGTLPPPSASPTLAGGDLVAPNAAAMGFPHIPGKPLPDGHLNKFLQYDFGHDFNPVDLSGAIDRQPPRIVQTLSSLVPRVDVDGNELAGIRSVQLQAPLGTYLGWNEVARGFEAGQGCGFQGGFIPFAVTKAQRLTTGDPRLSLEERYGTHETFVAKVKAAADDLVKQRFLLSADAERIVQQAQASNILK